MSLQPISVTIDALNEETGYNYFYSPCMLKISGSFTATLDLYVADDATGTNAVKVKSYTAPAVEIVDVTEGGAYLNVKCTAYTSGSAIVRMWE
jgi:hypothetical protein